jgi:TP901 family phage tail tape measure protein
MARRSSIVRVSVIGDATQLSQAFQSATRDTQALGEKLQKTGKDFTRNLTLPIVAGFTLAGRAAAEFDTSMTKIVTLVGVASEQVNAWRSEVAGLAAETAQSASGLAEALFQVTSAGFRGQAAMDVLEASAKAAAFGLGETVTVADAVTSAVNAYGAENLTAARATDILTAAVREGKLEAASLAPVIGKLLPTASAMGIGFEQVAGALAVMSRTGLDASEASTSLGAILTSLLKPGAEASRVLSDAGLSMSDLREIAAQPGGLIDVMRLLDGALGDNEEALVKVIPNVRAFRGVMNVLAQDASIVDSVMGGVADSVGLVDKAWEQLNESPAFRLKQAVNELKVAGTDLGAEVLPALADVAQAVAGVARAFREMSPAHKQEIINFGLLLAAVGPVLVILGKLATAWNAIKVAAAGAGAAQAAAGIAGAGAGAAGAVGGVGAAAGGAVAGLTARQAAQSQSIAALRASATTAGASAAAFAAAVAPIVATTAGLLAAEAASNKLGSALSQKLNPGMGELNIQVEDVLSPGRWPRLIDTIRDSIDATEDATSTYGRYRNAQEQSIFMTTLQAQEQEELNRVFSRFAPPGVVPAPDTTEFNRRLAFASETIRNFAREQLALTDPVLARALAEQRASQAQDRLVEVSKDKTATDRDREAAAIDVLVAEAELDAVSKDLADTISGPTVDALNAMIERSGLQHELFRFLIDDVREYDSALRTLGVFVTSEGRVLPIRDLERELIRIGQEVID